MFYNTISLNGNELLDAEGKVATQTLLIENIFKSNPGVHISPSEIKRLLDGIKKVYPITSIRRALTDLSSPKYNQVLQKTKTMVMGEYGTLQHTWVLRGSKEISQSEKTLPGKSTGDYAKEILSGVLVQKNLFD